MRTNLISEVSGLVDVCSLLWHSVKGVLIRLDATDCEVAKQRADAMLISAEVNCSLNRRARLSQKNGK